MNKEVKAGLRPFTPGPLGSEKFRLSRRLPRVRALKEILTVLRDQEVQRMKELVRGESEIDEGIARAKSNQAFSQGFLRLHVSLVRLSEIRLSAIWEAFDRLGQSRYGLCEQCGAEISLLRLRVDPMVQCCVSCGESNRTYDS
jgi:DnaK suppressor protein